MITILPVLVPLGTAIFVMLASRSSTEDRVPSAFWSTGLLTTGLCWTMVSKTASSGLSGWLPIAGGVAILLTWLVHPNPGDNPRADISRLLGLAGTLVVTGTGSIWGMVVGMELAAAPLLISIKETKSESPQLARSWSLRHVISLVTIVAGVTILTGMVAGSQIDRVLEDGANSGLMPSSSESRMAILAVGLTICGFAMRLSAAPFHLGTAELLTADDRNVALNLLTARLATAIALLKLIPQTLPHLEPVAESLLMLVAAIALLWSIVTLVVDSSVPRIMSGLLGGQAGTLFASLAIAGWEAEFPEVAFFAGRELPPASAVALMLFAIETVTLVGVVHLYDSSIVTEEDLLFSNRQPRTHLRVPANLYEVAGLLTIVALCGLPFLGGFWFQLAMLIQLVSSQTQSFAVPWPTLPAPFLIVAFLLIAVLFAKTLAAIRLLSSESLQLSTLPGMSTTRHRRVIAGVAFLVAVGTLGNRILISLMPF